MSIDRIIPTDVLVIGGGGAALRAAIAAHDHGARVTVVLKGETGRSGATVSPDSPGVAWQVADECCGSDDSPEVHAQNILDAGLGMADPRLARIMGYETVEQSRQLQQWGLRFIPDPKQPSRHYTGYSCFGDRPRAHGIANSGWGHAGDVVQVLLGQLRQRAVEVHESVFISDLLVDAGQCIGAVGISAEGEIVAYRAGAVVLAAGGARQVFPPEPGRTLVDTTGDSYALALRAGAELTNMEFVQYMLHPIPPFPVSVPGVFWALAPVVRNRYGEDALSPYLPPGLGRERVMRERTLHYPFSTRDHSKWLDVAFANEIRAGRGTDEGGLCLDFSRVDLLGFKPSRPQHIPEDSARPIELPTTPVQVRPAAHAVNGGVLIDEKAESSLPGLFAVAEAAAGPHGADRLGGGMVSNGQVFGARAGRFAAERAKSCDRSDLCPRILRPCLDRLTRNGHHGRDPRDVLSALQTATGRSLVVSRRATGLESLLARLEELSHEWMPQVAVPTPAMLRRALEVENSLVTAELMARAALLRTESRGSHYREDFPQQDDANWRTNIIFSRNSDGVVRHQQRSIENRRT